MVSIDLVCQTNIGHKEKAASCERVQVTHRTALNTWLARHDRRLPSPSQLHAACGQLYMMLIGSWIHYAAPPAATTQPTAPTMPILSSYRPVSLPKSPLHHCSSPKTQLAPPQTSPMALRSAEVTQIPPPATPVSLPHSRMPRTYVRLTRTQPCSTTFASFASPTKISSVHPAVVVLLPIRP